MPWLYRHNLGATVVVREYTGITGPLCFAFVVFILGTGGLEVARFPLTRSRHAERCVKYRCVLIAGQRRTEAENQPLFI